MIKLSGAREELDNGILYDLQTVEIVTRQTRKYRITVVKPCENKTCYKHCTCATGDTAPNATDLPLDTKTSRCEATDVVSQRQCSVQVQSEVFHGGNRLDVVKVLVQGRQALELDVRISSSFCPSEQSGFQLVARTSVVVGLLFAVARRN